MATRGSPKTMRTYIVRGHPASRVCRSVCKCACTLGAAAAGADQQPVAVRHKAAHKVDNRPSHSASWSSHKQTLTR
jgi:hypothetical protein